MNEKNEIKLNSHDVTCNYPSSSEVPDKPSTLSFKATSANASKMWAWLLQKYAASTFNICPHKLNQISGPPLEIHLEDNVKPRVLQNPAHVLIY